MKESNDVFIGFLVSGDLDDVLRLQAVLQGKAKGSLVRELLSQHAENNNWSPENTVERYAQHLYSQWNLRWRDIESFVQYMRRIKDSMKNKHKLPDRLAKSITDRCVELHEKNQSEKK